MTNIKLWDILNFIGRNVVWIMICILSMFLFKPGLAEIKTLLLILSIESFAIALSGMAVYAFTKIDFLKQEAGNTLGLIFLGVHICVGLSVLGVYIAQFAG